MNLQLDQLSLDLHGAELILVSSLVFLMSRISEKLNHLTLTVDLQNQGREYTVYDHSYLWLYA